MKPLLVAMRTILGKAMEWQMDTALVLQALVNCCRGPTYRAIRFDSGAPGLEIAPNDGTGAHFQLILSRFQP